MVRIPHHILSDISIYLGEFGNGTLITVSSVGYVSIPSRALIAPSRVYILRNAQRFSGFMIILCTPPNCENRARTLSSEIRLVIPPTNNVRLKTIISTVHFMGEDTSNSIWFKRIIPLNESRFVIPLIHDGRTLTTFSQRTSLPRRRTHSSSSGGRRSTARGTSSSIIIVRRTPTTSRRRRRIKTITSTSSATASCWWWGR